MNSSGIRAGIDIGGTKINLGLVTEEGEILGSRMIPSGDARDVKRFADRVGGELEGLLRECGISMENVAHVGVGIPGTADPRRGIVEYSCNLFGDQPVNLGETLKSRLQRPVTVVQDSWAACWAESLFGAGKDADSLLCLTIGTGIGCGVLLHGRIYGGPMHTAGEIGHTPVVWQGRPCSCGRRGCLEAYASGTAIWNQAMERFPQKLAGGLEKAEAVFSMAYAGDEDALKLIRESVEKLACGIAIAIDLFSVDRVVISGGLSSHRAMVIDPLEQKIVEYGYPSWAGRRSITVLPAELGADAPMVGAAFLTAEEIQY